jgi:MFS family permease
MLIISLQGIWLPLHGYSFERTPLWAGIYMLPLTAGFLLAGPVSGWLTDRFGARPFATGGMLVAALSYLLLLFLPANFVFPVFGALILLNGIGFGLFAAPNATGIMNSVPARQRGAASGMRATFQNSGMVLSIGIFFSLMVLGLSASLPHSMAAGLRANGVAPAKAAQVAKLPPVGSLFSAFLGYNPMKQLLVNPAKAGVSAAHWSTITGTKFFPHLISSPFMTGLRITFATSVLLSLVAAWASWMRGGRYVHEEGSEKEAEPGETEPVGPFGSPPEPAPAADETPEPEEWVPA